tara:strand:+ start:275 stop:541 length:267 start_codon:yes stop_codon:yes gene_type:complete
VCAQFPQFFPELPGLAHRLCRDCSRLARPNHEELSMDLLRIILAILLPPLGVFLQVGLTLHFWLNILLTLLGWLPGVIHAIWVIVTRD